MTTKVKQCQTSGFDLPARGEHLRVLIYKRTHQGDPDKKGWFGHNGCMGNVRCSDFCAVIGIGGIGKKPINEGIAGKLNWIGIGANPESLQVNGAPVWTFKHFRLFEAEGKELAKIAPTLSSRFYSLHPPRRIFSDSPKLNDAERKEIEVILNMARSASPSEPFRNPRKSTKCPTKCMVCTALLY